MDPAASLPRRAAAEFLGTGLLVAVVVGSGIAGQRLSPGDVGLQLLENSTATVLGLGVLIVVLGPVSGAHFNPVVTLTDWLLHHVDADPLERAAATIAAYIAAQLGGAIAGAALANAMFDAPTTWSTTDRTGTNLWLAETVATAGLILVIFSLARTGRGQLAAPAVAAYIGAAYWFTASTSFANPAVTLGRAFTDTFAGIAPAAVPGFVIAQLAGGAIGLGLVLILHPPRKVRS